MTNVAKVFLSIGVLITLMVIASDSTEAPTTTKTASVQDCNPNYSGCLKSGAGDYDCASGSGNGPNYTGTVRVIGYDEFGLDRDGDGWGCE